jgi:hypothetical protein
VTERAAFRLVLEQRNGHLNDHVLTSRDASITAAGSEPGPGGVSPGAAIRAGCADSGGRGQSQHRTGPGYGGARIRGGPALSLAGHSPSDRDLSAQGRRPAGISAYEQDGDGVPGAGADNCTAVAAYQLSVQAGNPLSERKLAQMFGSTSRRWARARITEARQSP